VSLTRGYQGATLQLAIFVIRHKKKGPPSMSPLKLFASIKERRRRSAQQPYEKGAQIRRRLQELVAFPTPTQVERSFTNARIENDAVCLQVRQN
jgi:hypothetical protein